MSQGSLGKEVNGTRTELVDTQEMKVGEMYFYIVGKTLCQFTWKHAGGLETFQKLMFEL